MLRKSTTIPKVNQYAQRIISTPGKHDGLAWQNSDGTGRSVERNRQSAGARLHGAEPAFHGYYFKVLKGQGPAAPLGQMDFVVRSNDRRIRPGGSTGPVSGYGVQTFIVGPNGSCTKKILGKYAEGVSEHGPITPIKLGK
ncbi:MAG: hypothetical protein Udaeo2_33610 [Candidatus Udaeobacter sp.]|nr:MAG: hypothetical protein Udaeo2_33610 [Candidatus Udaeobacter sp.]